MPKTTALLLKDCWISNFPNGISKPNTCIDLNFYMGWHGLNVQMVSREREKCYESSDTGMREGFDLAPVLLISFLPIYLNG